MRWLGRFSSIIMYKCSDAKIYYWLGRETASSISLSLSLSIISKAVPFTYACVWVTSFWSVFGLLFIHIASLLLYFVAHIYELLFMEHTYMHYVICMYVHAYTKSWSAKNMIGRAHWDLLCTLSFGSCKEKKLVNNFVSMT